MPQKKKKVEKPEVVKPKKQNKKNPPNLILKTSETGLITPNVQSNAESDQGTSPITRQHSKRRRMKDLDEDSEMDVSNSTVKSFQISPVSNKSTPGAKSTPKDKTPNDKSTPVDHAKKGKGITPKKGSTPSSRKKLNLDGKYFLFNIAI